MKPFAFACGTALVVALLPFAQTATHAQQIKPGIFSDLHWRNIGPWRSGNVSAPTGAPGDPTTFYVGLPEGGVWKTIDGGTTWKPIFDEEHVPTVGAVAVAPSDHNVIYVGTGNQTGWSFTPGKGVYKSTDAGQTWSNVGLKDSEYIGSIAVDAHNADHVLVAALGPRAPGGRGRGAADEGPAPAGARGVYQSTDGGRSWTKVLPKEGSLPASDLYMDFADPQIVFALLGTGGGFGAAAQPDMGGTGIFKSTDGGATWQPVPGTGLPEGARITALTYASGTHGQRLYAVATTGAGRGAGRGAVSRALYRSDDGGQTWQFGTRQLASGGGKIYADPQHPDVMYLMGTSVYRSTDGGRHVASYWGAPSGADPRELWIDPTDSRRMIAGVDQGTSISVDSGQTWTPYYGIVNGQFYRIATDYDVPYHVCGPQQDSGTACVPSRTDFGELRPYDWYPAGGFENGFLIADPLDKHYMYTQGWYHVMRRFDKTTNQVVVLYQPSAADRFGGAPPLAFSPEDPHTMYMAAQYLLVSKDRGLTWTHMSPDLAAAPGQPEAAAGGGGVGAAAAGGSITALAPSPIRADVIWVGASTGLIHVTRDGGKTWSDVTPKALPPSSINIIDASHADPGTAYVALLSRDAHPHFYRTTDYGATWQDISAGIGDDGTARVIREDPKDPQLLYAGTVTSIYVSFDRGDHWQSLQLNLPNTVISDITVHDDDVAISTYGRGFWILDDVTPLRQARAALASTTPVYFYKPAPASRIRWDNTQDTPLPPEMIVGPNPPEGAILDYYLPADASGTVTLQIKDARGTVVREFSSVAPPIDTSMPNVPEYWIAPPTVLPTTAGMHRISWDLRYPDPPILNYGYSGGLLDYREYTLNWHAIPGQTYRSTVVGPMVLPGSFSATLTVNGQSVTQPVNVVQDPRMTVPTAGLEAQFHLEQRMVAGITVTYHAVTYLDELNDAVQKLNAGASGGVQTAVQGLESTLKGISGGSGALGLAHRDLTRRINDQVVADAAPTPSVMTGVDEPCAAIDKALGELRQMESTSLADLNTQLTRAGQKALPTWAPPAAPACGR